MSPSSSGVSKVSSSSPSITGASKASSFSLSISGASKASSSSPLFSGASKISLSSASSPDSKLSKTNSGSSSGIPLYFFFFSPSVASDMIPSYNGGSSFSTEARSKSDFTWGKVAFLPLLPFPLSSSIFQYFLSNAKSSFALAVSSRSFSSLITSRPVSFPITYQIGAQSKYLLA